MYARNILVRRQCHFRFRFQAEVKVPVLYGEQDLGLTCYYDENTYLTYGISKRKEEYWIRVVEHIGDETTCAWEQKVDILVGDILELCVDTDYLKRSFSFRNITQNSSTYTKTGSLENVYYLCDEGIRRGKRFTGAMVGIYVYSGREVSRLVGEYRNMAYTEITVEE